jgi:hypothetical protein
LAWELFVPPPWLSPTKGQTGRSEKRMSHHQPVIISYSQNAMYECVLYTS